VLEFGSLPTWLLAGVAMGVVAVVLVAGIFVAGDRFFPAPPTDGRRRIDGTVRRRAEIRDFLGSIDERFVEDATVHGHTVAFYLPVREVAITFDPRAYFGIEGEGTYAVLCEHEMPGAQLGRRLPFEVPEQSTASAGGSDGGPDPHRDRSPGPVPVRTAFSRLGLQPGADAEQVKAAYRRRVKDAHPDAGGDSESFKRLREAYTTAREHAD
jgi:hypothetical protein